MTEEERIEAAESLFGPRPTGPASPEKQQAVAAWQGLIDEFVDWASTPLLANEKAHLADWGLGQAYGWLSSSHGVCLAFPDTVPEQKQFNWLKRVKYQPIDELRNVGMTVKEHQKLVINAGGCLRDLHPYMLAAETQKYVKRNQANCQEAPT